MRTRKIVRQENGWDIVWFKSYGLNTIASYVFHEEDGEISGNNITFRFGNIPSNNTVILEFTAKAAGTYIFRQEVISGKYESGNYNRMFAIGGTRGISSVVFLYDTIDWNYPIKISVGTAKLTDSNYSENEENVADSLQQRLSVIRGELFYNIIHGIPLANKVNKIAIDTSIMSIVNAHPEVTGIVNFDSEQSGDKYSARLQINTIYGTVNLSI